MINPQNGYLILNNIDLIIRPGITKHEILNSDLAQCIRTQDEYENGYSNYLLEPQPIGAFLFPIRLYFNPQGILDLIMLFLRIDDEIPSWENWLEQKEMDRKAKHDMRLEECLGKPPYKYSWGSISSNYDPRSASSGIAIHYVY